jgi:hypothetical protein
VGGSVTWAEGLTAVATTCSLLGAVTLYWLDRRRAWSSQAAKVYVWPARLEPDFEPDQDEVHYVLLVNESDAPEFGLEMHDVTRGIMVRAPIVLRPNTTTRVMSIEPESEVRMRFRDAAGRWWLRDQRGRLHRSYRALRP